MELRLYSFVNYYLSPIQAGIQTGHAAVDLVRQYRDDEDANHRMVQHWADDHKTFIVLNGGNHSSLLDAVKTVCQSGLPHMVFSEDQASLGGIMTCVAVVVPEMVFNAQRIDPNSEVEYFEYFHWSASARPAHFVYGPASPEFELIKLLKSSRLF